MLSGLCHVKVGMGGIVVHVVGGVPPPDAIDDDGSGG